MGSVRGNYFILVISTTSYEEWKLHYGSLNLCFHHFPLDHEYYDYFDLWNFEFTTAAWV